MQSNESVVGNTKPSSKDTLAINRRAVMTNDVHTWSRKITFNPKNVVLEQEVFDKWESSHQHQIDNRFCKVLQTKESIVSNIGLRLRSSANKDVLVDTDALDLKVTDAARLSRMHWEDILRVNEGRMVVVYFRNVRDIRDEFAAT